MLQIHSANCSPIKPHNHKSFGGKEVLTATVDWLESVDRNNLNEGNFADLSTLSEKMHDGPLKTFVKILSIGGAAFFAGKAGTSKVVSKMTSNKIVSKNIAMPVVKFVDGAIKSAKKALKASPFYGSDLKGFKSYVVNLSAKCLDELEKFGKRGSDKLVRSIESTITDTKNIAKSNGLSEREIKNSVKNLVERKRYAATENLINKVTTNTAGVGAGAIAVVQANKDKDENGIPDIGEHKVF